MKTLCALIAVTLTLLLLSTPCPAYPCAGQAKKPCEGQPEAKAGGKETPVNTAGKAPAGGLNPEPCDEPCEGPCDGPCPQHAKTPDPGAKVSGAKNAPATENPLRQNPAEGNQNRPGR